MFAEEDWSTKKASELLKVNQDFFNNTDTDGYEILVKRPINTIYFFVIFVLAMGYLWLEPKLER